jgi:hypothetical protein
MTAHADWLAAVSRRLLHRDTFQTMVSPALADLQAERHQGWRQRARHYAGLTVVFGFALLKDIRIDAGLTSFAAAWEVWRKAVAWHVALAIPLAAAFLWATPWRHLQGVEFTVLAMFALGLFGVPVSTTAAGFYLRRAGLTESRAVIAATVVPFVLFAPVSIGWDGLSPRAASLIYETAAPKIEAPGTPINIWERIWLANFKERRTESQQPLTIWAALRSVAALPLSPMIGVWLARRRGWRIFRSLLCLQCAFLVFGVAGTLVTGPGILANEALAIAFSLFSPALVWLLVLRGSTGRSIAGAAAPAR